MNHSTESESKYYKSVTFRTVEVGIKDQSFQKLAGSKSLLKGLIQWTLTVFRKETQLTLRFKAAKKRHTHLRLTTVRSVDRVKSRFSPRINKGIAIIALFTRNKLTWIIKTWWLLWKKASLTQSIRLWMRSNPVLHHMMLQQANSSLTVAKILRFPRSRKLEIFRSLYIKIVSDQLSCPLSCYLMKVRGKTKEESFSRPLLVTEEMHLKDFGRLIIIELLILLSGLKVLSTYRQY